MSATTFGPLEVPVSVTNPPFQRADLKFIGVDHSGSSFEARVFLNNPQADNATPKDPSTGYAGSFYIFGHGGCFGDEGHCDVPRRRVTSFDRRPPHQLTPTTKLVVITAALRGIVASASGPTPLTVTVVPVVRPSVLAKAEDAATVLTVDTVQLLTYD